MLICFWNINLETPWEISQYLTPRKINIEPEVMMVWKKFFLFQWCILRSRPFIFQGVGDFCVWEALLQKKNKMLEEALQLALKAQEKVWIQVIVGKSSLRNMNFKWKRWQNKIWEWCLGFFKSYFIDFLLVPWKQQPWTIQVSHSQHHLRPVFIA